MQVLEDADAPFFSLKLAMKSEMTDDEVEDLFLDAVVASRGDIEIIIDYLSQFRPLLLTRIFGETVEKRFNKPPHT